MKVTVRMERWRAVVGFEGRYEVSDLGNVRRLRCLAANGRWLNPKSVAICEETDGYAHVGLTKTGRSQPFKVATLVLLAFRGPRPSKHVGRHLDGNPMNSRLDNLAWGTYEENEADKRRHGRLVTSAKLSAEDVARVQDMRRFGVRCKDIAALFGLHPKSVSNLGRRYAVENPG